MAIKRPQVRHDLLQDVCLYALYAEFITDRADELSPQKIQAQIPDVPFNLVKRSLERLQEKGLTEETQKKSSRPRPTASPLASLVTFEREYVDVWVDSGHFKITDNGISKVETWSTDEYSEIESSFAVGKLIKDSPARLPENVSAEEDKQVPAANRFVSTRDNEPEADELRKNLSVIKEEFAKDHNKRALLLDNIDGYVDEISAFESALERDWIPLVTAKAFLETLKHIRTACVDIAIIAVATSQAIDALMKIIGLF